MNKELPKNTRVLDPKQVFVIRSVTRKEIAEAFNEMLDDEGTEGLPKIERFTPTDARLTDAICMQVADGSDTAICEEDGVVDREYEITKDILINHFGD
jgi:hypothetical protein